jgi:hypothetical protein
MMLILIILVSYSSGFSQRFYYWYIFVILPTNLLPESTSQDTGIERLFFWFVQVVEIASFFLWSVLFPALVVFAEDSISDLYGFYQVGHVVFNRSRHVPGSLILLPRLWQPRLSAPPHVATSDIVSLPVWSCCWSYLLKIDSVQILSYSLCWTVFGLYFTVPIVNEIDFMLFLLLFAHDGEFY